LTKVSVGVQKTQKVGPHNIYITLIFGAKQ